LVSRLCFRSAIPSRLLIQPSLQRDGVVVDLVAGGIEQGDHAALAPRQENAERGGCRLAGKLLVVGGEEIIPPLG
jgi:hypothetical protein